MAERTCEFCGKTAIIRGGGLCGACYQRRLRNGTPEYARRRGIGDDPSDPRHGTLNGYQNQRCRCDRCRAANTAAFHRIREERPDLVAARRVRAKAGRVPRGVPVEMRARMAEERAALALRHAHEMDELIGRQCSEAGAWIAEMRLEPLRERLAREEARVGQLRAAIGEREGARG